MSVFAGPLYLERCLRNYYFIVVPVANTECFSMAASRRNILVCSRCRILFHVPLHPLRVRLSVPEPKTRAFSTRRVKAGSCIVGTLIIDKTDAKREPLSFGHGVAENRLLEGGGALIIEYF